jgi:hypothetical protein
MWPLQRVGAFRGACLTEASSNRSNQCLHPDRGDGHNPTLARSLDRGVPKRGCVNVERISTAPGPAGASRGGESGAGRGEESPAGRSEDSQLLERFLAVPCAPKQHPLSPVFWIKTRAP